MGVRTFLETEVVVTSAHKQAASSALSMMRLAVKDRVRYGPNRWPPRDGERAGSFVGAATDRPTRCAPPSSWQGRQKGTACCGPLLLLKVYALARQFPSQSFRARTSSMLWMASATAASFPGAKVRSVDRDMRGKSARVA
jgi:hypothetical protein